MSVAVLINMHARRGSEDAASVVRRLLPDARVMLSRSLDDARAWLREELLPAPPRVLLAGGGDGTAVSLVTSMRDLGLRVGAFGLLPLGTGNAWATETHTPRLAAAVRDIADLHGAEPPVRAFPMVEVEGRLTPFAGSGWDAEIVADYQAMVGAHGDRTNELKAGFFGYMRSLFTKTIPRHMKSDGPPNVRLFSLDDDPLYIDPAGHPVRVDGAGVGTLLYEGPASVAGAATTTVLGLAMRCFPFVHAAPGRMEVRIYGAKVLEATRNIRKIWQGVHPLPKDHHWLLRRCRMDYDRDVPFEIGGDVVGRRRSVDFSLAAESIPMIDWSALRTPRLGPALG